ncbi:MAG: cell division protein FtsA [Chloroflexi bacterium]|nr:MAG: cell division protein FtsA [Chloroflexota bacterium]
MSQASVGTESELIAAIDVGSTKVCTILARKSRGGFPEVVSYSVVPSFGVTKGNVVDANAASQAIRKTMSEIRSDVGVDVKSAYVGITGSHIGYENRVDYFSDIGRQGVVTLDEFAKIPSMVSDGLQIPGRTIIHSLPIHYGVDGHDGIKNPVGMHITGLEVTTHLITADSYFADKLREAVTLSGIELKSMVLEPFASSEAILTQTEKDIGSAVVDIGGGTTDIVLFRNGSVVFTATIPVGGFQFTNDICLTYNVEFPDAEEAKLRYGHTNLAAVDLMEVIPVSPVGSSANIEIRRRDICQLMRERAVELIRLVDLKLQQGGLKENPNSLVYITGGASQLPGFYEMAEQFIPNCQVRRGIPDFLMRMTDELREPCYATAVGMILHAFRSESSAEMQLGIKDTVEDSGFLRRLINVLKLG